MEYSREVEAESKQEAKDMYLDVWDDAHLNGLYDIEVSEE